MTKRCAQSWLPEPSNYRTRKKAKFKDALRQACDPGFVPFGGSPPCRFPRANGVSQQAKTAMKELTKDFASMPKLFGMKKDADLKNELRKICTTEAGVVKWCDFARVFQSFHPDVAIEAVSEIWTFLGGGESGPVNDQHPPHGCAQKLRGEWKERQGRLALRPERGGLSPAKIWTAQERGVARLVASGLIPTGAWCSLRASDDAGLELAFGDLESAAYLKEAVCSAAVEGGYALRS
ncbi:hypothetical protein AK812_SmicGene45539, partial [Symbiodinium microadriaticum]